MLLDTIVCRKIGEKYYTLGDTNIICSDNPDYMFIILIPLFILFLIFIPLFMFLFISKIIYTER